jgi:hypothetical protein
LQDKSVKHNNFESSGAMVVCCTVEWHGPEYSSIIEQARKEDQIGVACLCELVFVGLASVKHGLEVSRHVHRESRSLPFCCAPLEPWGK